MVDAVNTGTEQHAGSEQTQSKQAQSEPQAPTVDVVGVGNAIVDVITQATDDFVLGEGITKNSMTLIDADRAHELYAKMGPGIESSGGSVANTMAGIASFGGSASFIGKVANDQLGEVFGHDMRAVGVNYTAPDTGADPSTARCLILVTPDAQRTMSTYLGVSSLLDPSDIIEDVVSAAKIVFCEGYLWDVDSAKLAIRKAMDVARAAGRKSALALSDTFCVERHHQEFRELVAGPVDILFANRAELASLYETEDLDAGVAALRHDVELGCVTLGKEGSLLVTPDDIVRVPAEEISPPVDTTGAGDQYAAGVLYGVAQGYDLARCGYLGSIAAAEVIAHVGARPLRSLRELAELS